MDVLSHRIFVLVNQVLRNVLHHELVGDGRHPSLHKRSQVQEGLAIQSEFVVDNLIGGIFVDTLW